MMHAAAVALWCALSPVQSSSQEAPAEDPIARELSSRPLPPPEASPVGPRWSVGVGVDVYTGFGSVFNDVVGPSFRAGYRLSERWSVAATLFRTDFDFEDPADNVFDRGGGTPVADASIDMIMFGATARRHFMDPSDSIDFYVGAGVGLAFPGSGEAVSLPQVDIEVEGNFGPETHLVVGGSIRIYDRLRFTTELRLLRSFTDYDVEDRVTGESETEKGWTGFGIGFGLEWSF